MQPYEDQVPMDDPTEEEEYYEDEEYEEYEDYDAPQIGDTIMTATENNDAWDDTALIEAWDEAVKEYQTYHSTTAADDPPFSKKPAAKPSKAAAAVPAKKRPPPIPAEEQVNTSANTKQAKRVKKTPSQPTAVLGQENLASTGNDAVPSQAAGETDTQASWDQHANYWRQQAYESNATSAPPPAPIPMSQPNFSTAGEDEALSNLMMAWYYSGYYTGYYQAMRRR
ncbi:hypothetical protein BGW37DRAFT_86981 [Umbelopsis sp. PMI_123]|nr:hypothetical protein BGW37DRAFT_86981 [Umbelopsis sp. PMI_123]